MNVWNIPLSINKCIADQSDSDQDNEENKPRQKKQILKSSFASAFQSIINKKLDEDKTPSIA